MAACVQGTHALPDSASGQPALNNEHERLHEEAISGLRKEFESEIAALRDQVRKLDRQMHSLQYLLMTSMKVMTML